MRIFSSAVVGMLILGTGCASLRPKPQLLVVEPATNQQCIEYDNNFLMWGGVAAGAGFLAGAGGITTAIPNDQAPRLMIGISSLVVGTLSAVGAFFASENAKRYTSRCTTSVHGTSSRDADETRIDEALAVAKTKLDSGAR